jgi:hypothetical protein
VSGAQIAGKIVNYQTRPHQPNLPPLTTLTANRGGIDAIGVFEYFFTETATLPSVPAINNPQFFLTGTFSTEFSLPGQFSPPNSTASRNHGATRAEGFGEFSFFGDQQPEINAAPWVLEGTVAHATEQEHVAYLALLAQALRDATGLEYRISGATYLVPLAQNVNSYFVRKSVQGLPWISELTLKLCVTSLEWTRTSGLGQGNWSTLL